MQRIKKLRVFAGPNGSGKSTLYNEIKHYFKTGFYINADDIESHLSLKRFIDLDQLGLKLTSNDLAVFSKTKEAKSLLKKSIESQHEIDIELIDNFIIDKSKHTHSYEASYTAAFIRSMLYVYHKSFCFETVMSHSSKLTELKKAKESGYKIYLYFVCTDNPEINITRVANRVDKGGHQVDMNKIMSRYERTLSNLYPAIQLADSAFLFDNSGKKFELIAEISNGNAMKLVSNQFPNWFINYVFGYFE